MYFLYTIDEMAEEPIMLIDKHIGNIDGDMGVMVDQFASELLALDGMGKKRIQIWVNSVGGSVMDGMSIYNAILRTKTKVDTYNVGIAASTAGWIFMAGRKRYMNDYAILMLHEPYNPASAQADKGLMAFSDSIKTMIANRCKKSYDEVSEMMKNETWLCAEECMEYGMCEEVTHSGSMNGKKLTEMSTVDAWQYANNILNISLNKNEKKMIKVANKLGITPDANEDSIVSAIEGIENKAAEYKNDMEAAQTENEELKARIAELEAEKVAAEQAAAEAKVAEIEASANALVAEYANVIPEGTEAGWVNIAKIDYENAKTLLSSLTVNKVAPKMGEATEETPATPYNVAHLMAQSIK
jgi:ATP-dependent Clp endopeptidase proteolytic subunit ClpP